ncbi:MAG: class I SAM-dependent methyltransferase [Phycisphaerales bacterium]|nr:class I SAM-dependent methyltransferase [Phycisphaerales bacterium]
MTTDYATIYNHQTETNPGYSQAEQSPGFKAVLENATEIAHLKGRSLDVGCGVGFVVELLNTYPYRFEAHGTDVSPTAVEQASKRNSQDRIKLSDGSALPYDDASFDLVTCFDVLEHIDEHEVEQFCNELRRVARPGATIMCSVALREASAIDLFGDNVHRTVRPFDWWAQYLRPDKAHWTKHPMQAIYWHNIPHKPANA